MQSQDFETAIPVIKLLNNYALDRTAAGIGILTSLFRT